MDNTEQLPANVTPPSTSQQPEVDMVSYHESNQVGATSDDLPEIANLFQRVGNELYTVDSKNVGGESASKALQLDKASVFSGIDKVSTPPPSAPPSSAGAIPVQGGNPFTPVVGGQPVEVPGPKPPPVPPTGAKGPQTVVSAPVASASNTDLSKIEKRLTRLESASRAFKNARKIKRGNVYSVSSNSMKGQLKDAELVAEFVMSELAKGVRTITIKLNDSKHSE